MNDALIHTSSKILAILLTFKSNDLLNFMKNAMKSSEYIKDFNKIHGEPDSVERRPVPGRPRE